MEAPVKGLSPEDLVKKFEDHIKDHYEKVNGVNVCKKCGTRVEQVTCYISVHSKMFSSCTGGGEVKQVPLPYCPKCEGVPKNTSTCMHE